MKAVKAKLLYDGSKNTKENVYIIFDKKIKKITKTKPKCEIIGEGIVTPAFVDSHSHIGLCRSGEPYQEDEANEGMDSFLFGDPLDSIYLDDKAFSESVEHGVLYSNIMPCSGNIIGGRCVLIKNYAKNTAEAFMKYTGVKMAFGYNPRSTTDWKGSRPYTRMGAAYLLRTKLSEAVKTKKLIEKKKKKPEEISYLTEHLIKIIENKERLMIHVHKEDDIIAIIRIAKEFKLKNIVINHACDINTERGFKIIKDSGFPVVYGPVDSFPPKVELKNESWKNMEYLVKANLKFGLISDHPVVLQRNLFLQLRFFRHFGLSKAECISIITKQNAEIIGAKEIGEIKENKLASLVIWKEDPFSLGAHPKIVIGEGEVLR